MRSTGDCLVVTHRKPRQQCLERLFDRAAAGLRVRLEPRALDLAADPDHLVDQLRVLVAEVGADRVQLGVHQRAQEGGLGGRHVGEMYAEGAHRWPDATTSSISATSFSTWPGSPTTGRTGYRSPARRRWARSSPASRRTSS